MATDRVAIVKQSGDDGRSPAWKWYPCSLENSMVSYMENELGGGHDGSDSERRERETERERWRGRQGGRGAIEREIEREREIEIQHRQVHQHR